MYRLKTAYRTLLSRCAVVAILVVFSRPALAGTAYVAIVGRWPDIIGVGVTDSGYAMENSHTAYATVTVTSPSGRSATNTESGFGTVTVYTYLPLLGEDGSISARNVSEEYCPAVGRTFENYPPPWTGEDVKPYVWVANVFASGDLKRQLGESTVTIQVSKSNNCPAGSATVQATCHAVPTDIQLILPNPDYGPATFGAGSTGKGEFSVKTGPANATAGVVSCEGGSPL